MAKLRMSAATWVSLALLAMPACSPDPAAPCARCTQDAAQDAAHDANLEPGDAASPEDAATAQDAMLLDAGPEPAPDAAAADAAPAYTECVVSQDCALPEGTLACEHCSDGSTVCPELRCVGRLCVATLRSACPGQTRAACGVDADCERRDCSLLCQGDGRTACRRDSCIEGHCVPNDGTCGLHLSACPEGSRAGQECAGCDAGTCEYRVLGCFDSCETSATCPASQKCVAGLCQLVSCS